MGAATLKSFKKIRQSRFQNFLMIIVFSSRKWAKEGVRVIWHKQNQLKH